MQKYIVFQNQNFTFFQIPYLAMHVAFVAFACMSTKLHRRRVLVYQFEIGKLLLCDRSKWKRTFCHLGKLQD